MLEKVRTIVSKSLPGLPLDTVAFALIDFQSGNFDSFQLSRDEFLDDSNPIWFDLASITKAMTNAATKILRPEIFNEEMELVLNHSAGIPWWGRLSQGSWREQILSYPIKKSDTVYSDFSALRAMLMIEEKLAQPIYDFCSCFHDEEVKNWLDLPFPIQIVRTGWRGGRPIRGEVHDDNAYVIHERVSHAGLFSTIGGLARTVLNLDKQGDLLLRMKTDKKTVSPRFLNGFDTVMDPGDTLAGPGCGPKTFGHMGFTGTSLWIDPERKVGSIILTNGTRDYWNERETLNAMRRTIGSQIWSSF